MDEGGHPHLDYLLCVLGLQFGPLCLVLLVEEPLVRLGLQGVRGFVLLDLGWETQ